MGFCSRSHNGVCFLGFDAGLVAAAVGGVLVAADGGGGEAVGADGTAEVEGGFGSDWQEKKRIVRNNVLISVFIQD